MTRLTETITAHFYHPRLGDEVKRQVASCNICQRTKRASRQYGELAPRDTIILPWNEVQTDCIGPWQIPLRGNKSVEIKALTTIDTATNLLEVNRLTVQTSKEVAATFANNWLSRYPQPSRCVHDQGPEFMGQDFQNMLTPAGVKSVPTTARNPQGNSIVERIHQAVGQVIRTLVDIRNPKTVHEAKAIIDEALATAMHATRCASSSALQGLSPGAVVFHRDMHSAIPFYADLLSLQQNRQAIVDNRLLKANAKRIHHDYQVGDPVLKKRVLSFSDKLRAAWTGPFNIEQVHTNGTVTIRLDAHSTERINIRRIKPYMDIAGLVESILGKGE